MQVIVQLHVYFVCIFASYALLQGRPLKCAPVEPRPRALPVSPVLLLRAVQYWRGLYLSHRRP